jgi:hypothetical protein
MIAGISTVLLRLGCSISRPRQAPFGKNNGLHQRIHGCRLPRQASSAGLQAIAKNAQRLDIAGALCERALIRVRHAARGSILVCTSIVDDADPRRRTRGVVAVRDRDIVASRRITPGRLNGRAGLGEIGHPSLMVEIEWRLTGKAPLHLLPRFRAAPDVSPNPER